jgi:antirestriction protein
MNKRNKLIENNDCPKIYIACLSAYNNGFLHGSWIDVSKGLDHVEERIFEILSSSPMSKEETCEEWAIHDFQGFGDYKVSEYHNLECLCDIAEFLARNESDFPVKVISQLVNDFGLEVAKEKLDDDFIGNFDTITDLAYHYVEETGLLYGVHESIAMYFDYDSFGRDLELNGDVTSYNNYYFFNR